MKKNTKYIILSFFVVLGIVLVIIGSSYSLFNYQVKGKQKIKLLQEYIVVVNMRMVQNGPLIIQEVNKHLQCHVMENIS